MKGKARLNKNDIDRIMVVGRSYWEWFNEANSNNRKYHIRAIVDGDQFVVRSWSVKRGWIYQVLDRIRFEVRYDYTYYEELITPTNEESK